MTAPRPSSALADIPSSGKEALEWFDPRLLYTPAHVEKLDLEEKAASLKLHGFLNPITLSARGYVVDGYRRLLAAKLAGLTEAPYVVNFGIDTPAKELATVFATEEARSSRNPAAHAMSLKQFMEREKLTQKEVAKLTGISEPKLSRYFTLLSYPPDVIEAVGKGVISMAHVLAVNQLEATRRMELVYLAMSKPEITAAKLKLMAFPPKKKPARQQFAQKFEVGSLTVILKDALSIEAFDAAWVEIKELLAAKLKELDKRSLPLDTLIRRLS